MSLNALQWKGAPGRYEVYYLSATDPRSGVGLWIGYTMLAPLHGCAECALWFMAMVAQRTPVDGIPLLGA